MILKREDAVGRGVVSDLYQGEPILDSRLAAVGSGGGLAATIPQGMRACAVKVDDVVGVAGFVTPGMRVDVLISGNAPGAANASEGTQVKTLLQNIQVLSAGTDIQKDAEGKPQQVQVVNLLVTPDQAEIPEPGEQSDAYPARFAQSAGSERYSYARDRRGQSLRGCECQAEGQARGDEPRAAAQTRTQRLLDRSLQRNQAERRKI